MPIFDVYSDKSGKIVTATEEEWNKLEKEWNKNHPVLHFINEIWDFFYYPISRFWDYYLNPMNYYREIKYFIQRGIRGWSDRDNWCIFHYNAKVMKEMLSAYKNNGRTSIIISDLKDREPTTEEWKQAERDTEKILDQIIHAFTQAEIYGNGDLELYNEHIWKEEQKEFREEMTKKYNSVFQTKEEYDKMQEGFRLFIKHYFSLWD
jgi:hypothetical protein